MNTEIILWLIGQGIFILTLIISAFTSLYFRMNKADSEMNEKLNKANIISTRNDAEHNTRLEEIGRSMGKIDEIMIRVESTMQSHVMENIKVLSELSSGIQKLTDSLNFWKEEIKEIKIEVHNLRIK